MNAVRGVKIFSYVVLGAGIGSVLGVVVSIVNVIMIATPTTTKGVVLTPITIGFLLGGIIGLLWGIWKTNK